MAARVVTRVGKLELRVPHDRAGRFSTSSISAATRSLDEGLSAFAERRLEEHYPYLILDARYEGARGGG
jgi:transposase-like protein